MRGGVESRRIISCKNFPSFLMGHACTIFQKREAAQSFEFNTIIIAVYFHIATHVWKIAMPVLRKSFNEYGIAQCISNPTLRDETSNFERFPCFACMNQDQIVVQFQA